MLDKTIIPRESYNTC